MSDAAPPCPDEVAELEVRKITEKKLGWKKGGKRRQFRQTMKIQPNIMFPNPLLRMPEVDLKPPMLQWSQ